MHMARKLAAMAVWLGAALQVFAAEEPAAAASAASAAREASPLLAPSEQVGWVSQGEWSRRWWEWAMSFDSDTSPVADRTGALCGNRQEGDVWFLAGTHGTARTVRSCRVPRDKYLFFPLVNYIVYSPRGAVLSCAQLTRDVTRLSEGAELLVLEIDGVRHDDLVRHRQAAPECFNAWARRGAGVSTLAAANGYYVMLKPLPPGRHTLNFGGALRDVSQAVSYTLWVE